MQGQEEDGAGAGAEAVRSLSSFKRHNDTAASEVPLLSLLLLLIFLLYMYMYAYLCLCMYPKHLPHC